MSLTKVTFSMISGAFTNVLDFGADPTGVADSRQACQDAIDKCRADGGGTVYFPAGTYKIVPTTSPDSKPNGLLIEFTTQHNPNQRVMLVGEGKATILQPAGDDMYVIRLADSYCAIKDLSIVNSGSFTGVSAIGLVPEDLTQTTSVVYQTWNVLSGLFIQGCAEGLELQAGPRVSGADSGQWYNGFYDIHIYKCLRGIFLKDSNNGGVGSGANRNNFYNIRIGEDTNTGLYIQSGSTNKFFGVDFEGIASGVTPSATPTAIIIDQANGGGGSNDTNEFYGCVFEANTRDLDNSNSYSNFFGCNINATKTANENYGMFCIGGNGPTETPIYIGGQMIQAGLLTGYDSGTTFYTQSNKATVDLQGRVKSTASFEEKSGNTGIIADSATYVITGLTPKRPYLLSLYSNADYGDPALYLVCGDGTNNLVSTTIQSSAEVSAAGSAATSITLTNTSGVAATIYWVVTPFGTPGA